MNIATEIGLHTTAHFFPQFSLHYTKQKEESGHGHSVLLVKRVKKEERDVCTKFFNVVFLKKCRNVKELLRKERDMKQTKTESKMNKLNNV